jgi:hypothetical protein
MPEQPSHDPATSDLLATVERLTAERDALAARLVVAEQTITTVRDGYRHQIYELRERVAGACSNRTTRLLETALDAARAERPRIPVVIERIEDVLATLAAFVQAERNPQA